MKELDLLKEAETAGSTDAAAGADPKRGSHVAKSKKAKYARPVKVDEVCWIKNESGHIVIKVRALIYRTTHIL